MTYRSVSTSWL